MQIEEIIGKGKLYEPPFCVALDNGNIFYPVITDSKGEMLCCGVYNIEIANHIVELLNERWGDETR